MKKVILVDDDQHLLDAVCRTMRRHEPDWKVVTYTDPEAALKDLKQCNYNVIVSDVDMGPINGVTFLRDSRIFNRDAMRIILSGKGENQTVIEAINEGGIFRYLTKPILARELIATINLAINFQNYQLENERLAGMVRELDGLGGDTISKLQELRQDHPDVDQLLMLIEQGTHRPIPRPAMSVSVHC